MAREIGYYWVRSKHGRPAEWVVGKWDGLHFFLSSVIGPIRSHFLEIDERRIVRKEVGDGKEQAGADGDSG